MIPVGGVGVSIFKRLDLHVVFGLTEPPHWKRADPQPRSISAPRLTVKVHRRRPGRSCPISNSLLDSLSRESSLQLPTFLRACRQSRIFTPEYIFSLTKTVSRLWGTEVEGLRKPPSLFFSVRNYFKSWQMQTDRCLACLFMEVDQQIISWLQCDSSCMLLIVKIPKDWSPFFCKETFASTSFPFSVQDKLIFT